MRYSYSNTEHMNPALNGSYTVSPNEANPDSGFVTGKAKSPNGDGGGKVYLVQSSNYLRSKVSQSADPLLVHSTVVSFYSGFSDPCNACS